MFPLPKKRPEAAFCVPVRLTMFSHVIIINTLETSICLFVMP